MKWAALASTLANLVLRVVNIIVRHKAEQERAEYERENTDIRNDPIDYANNKFVRPDNGDPETLSRDYTDD